MSKIGKLLTVVGSIAVGAGIGYLLFSDKCKCSGCCGCDDDEDEDEEDEFFDDLDDDFVDESKSTEASETSKREYIEINS